MEAALQTMLERNHHVVSLMEHRTVRPIRMRFKKLTLNVPVSTAIAYMPSESTGIARWQDKGGLLMYRPQGRSFKGTHPASDALLLVEAPLQWEWLQDRIANVRQEVVIYRPPTWELHTEAIEHRYPHRHAFETLEAMLAAFKTRDLPEDLAIATDVVPHWDNPVVFTEDEAYGVAGWEGRFIRSLLNKSYLRTSIKLSVFSLRFPPDDADMRWAYDIIREQPEVRPRQHVLPNDKPQGEYLSGFRRMLWKLMRYNHIIRESGIYIVNGDRPPLQLDRIEAIYNMHRGKWFKVRSFVDELPEYQHE
jgi:hypothetical protein